MRSLCLVLALALAGCTNGFLDFYQGSRYAPVADAQRVGWPPAGAERIGESVFTSARNEAESDLIEAACEVGADFVTWEWQEAGMTQSVFSVPVTTPTASTTYYSGGVYGGGGYSSFHANATTYGSQTSYVPYMVSQRWLRHTARFYRAGRPATDPNEDDPFVASPPIR